jgi:hypothetical protein
MLLRFFKSLPLVLPFIALFLSGVAFAHDGIKSTALEGTSEDNAVTMGHGCEQANGTVKPIIAQSVVFPSDSPILTTSDGSTIADLSEVIDQGSIAGLANLIQSRDIFLVQKEKHDANGNVTGFYGKTGLLDVEALGRVPFAFTSPNFASTSCAKKLDIVVAVADICVATNPKIRAGKVNLWIPDNGSTYAIQGNANGVEGIGHETPTLQVNRDLAANPLDPSCGEGIDVTVTPSAADINANLGIAGYW